MREPLIAIYARTGDPERDAEAGCHHRQLSHRYAAGMRVSSSAAHPYRLEASACELAGQADSAVRLGDGRRGIDAKMRPELGRAATIERATCMLPVVVASAAATPGMSESSGRALTSGRRRHAVDVVK